MAWCSYTLRDESLFKVERDTLAFFLPYRSTWRDLKSVGWFFLFHWTHFWWEKPNLLSQHRDVLWSLCSRNLAFGFTFDHVFERSRVHLNIRRNFFQRVKRKEGETPFASSVLFVSSQGSLEWFVFGKFFGNLPWCDPDLPLNYVIGWMIVLT